MKKRVCILVGIGIGLLLCGYFVIHTLGAITKDEWDNLEVVKMQADRMQYQNLNEIETNSTIIVEAEVVDTIGQEFSTYHVSEFEKDVPGSGFTKRKLKIQEVYKGDVSKGDTIVLMQDYYVWTDENDEKKLISMTELKPLTNGNKYLLFLTWSKNYEAYYETGDFQGVYPLQMDESQDKEFTHVYPSEAHSWNLVPIYEEVQKKYIK